MYPLARRIETRTTTLWQYLSGGEQQQQILLNGLLLKAVKYCSFVFVVRVCSKQWIGQMSIKQLASHRNCLIGLNRPMKRWAVDWAWDYCMSSLRRDRARGLFEMLLSNLFVMQINIYGCFLSLVLSWVSVYMSGLWLQLDLKRVLFFRLVHHRLLLLLLLLSVSCLKLKLTLVLSCSQCSSGSGSISHRQGSYCSVGHW